MKLLGFIFSRRVENRVRRRRIQQSVSTLPANDRGQHFLTKPQLTFGILQFVTRSISASFALIFSTHGFQKNILLVINKLTGFQMQKDRKYRPLGIVGKVSL